MFDDDDTYRLLLLPPHQQQNMQNPFFENVRVPLVEVNQATTVTNPKLQL